MADKWTKCLFYSSFEKLEPNKKINFPTIKVFPKDTSFFSLPHARRRPFRRATVAIWKDIKRACAEYAVRAISRTCSAIETSLRFGALNRVQTYALILLIQHRCLNQSCRSFFFRDFRNIRGSVLMTAIRCDVPLESLLHLSSFHIHFQFLCILLLHLGLYRNLGNTYARQGNRS